jgi:hypothetical protein
LSLDESFEQTDSLIPLSAELFARSPAHQEVFAMDHFVDKLDRDRRLSLRHNFRTDLRIRVRRSTDGEQRAESENLSQRGVFFATDLELSKGAALDLLIEMPEQITGVPAAQWLCTGHVVRVAPMVSSRGSRGVGVQFDSYEVSRPEWPQGATGTALRGPTAAQVHR